MPSVSDRVKFAVHQWCTTAKKQKLPWIIQDDSLLERLRPGGYDVLRFYINDEFCDMAKELFPLKAWRQLAAKTVEDVTNAVLDRI